MDLRDLARVLRQRRVLVIAVAVIVTVLATSRGLTPERSFSATAQALAPQMTLASVLSPEQPVPDIEWQVAFVRSADVAGRAAALLAEDGITGDYAFSVAPAATTSDYLLTITASSADPGLAAAAANAVAEAYVLVTAERLQADVDALLGTLDSGVTGNDTTIAALTRLPALEAAKARIVQAAAVPSAPSTAGRVLRLGLLGLTLGLVVGVAAAFVVDQLDDRLRGADAVRRLSGAPVVAGISGASRDAADDDALLVLATRLRETRPGTVLLTAPDDVTPLREAVVALGSAFARSGARTAIVDCDPWAHDKSLGSSLAQALEDPARAPQQVTALTGGVTALGATGMSEEALSRLTSADMARVVERLEAEHDMVLLLAAPWTRPAATLGVTKLARSAVVVVALDRSKCRDLEGLVGGLAGGGLTVAAALAVGDRAWSHAPLEDPATIGV